MTKTKIVISHVNSNKKICLSTAKDNKPSIVNRNNQKVKTLNLYETKINRNNAYRMDSYSFNYLLYQYILLILLTTVLSYIPQVHYITLQVNEIGFQQIFSDNYDINEFYPAKIYINDKIHILRNKKVLIESVNDTIRIEWFNTNKNLTYMFANLQSIASITLNNMLNSAGNNNMSNMFYNCQNLK